MFGLEIRTKGKLENIYKDVDTILTKHKIERGKVTGSVVRDAVAHSLFNMFQTDKHFSICTIDQCIKATGINITRERYNVYHTQHCVNWRDMLPEFKEQLVAMILDDFKEVLTYEESKDITHGQIGNSNT